MAKYKIIPSSRTIVQSPISIGHKAEKGVEAIEFDLTAWVETYGSGTLTVIMRRWGDAIPYPIALEIDENNKATWVLSDIDTEKAGMAYAQLSYIVGETVVKKSDIYTFRVMDSLTGEGDPPEAYESWLEHLTHLAAEAMAEVLDIEGVATDKTLTVDGGIADAKATGDALALKADKSTTYTKTEVDALIDEVEIETDTTLSISGKPADSKTVGDELSDIKADLDSYQTVETVEDWEDGSIGNDGKGSVVEGRIRTATAVSKATGCLSIGANTGYEFFVAAWGSDGTFVGVLRTDGTFKRSGTILYVTSFALSGYADYSYKIVMRRTDSTNITLEESNNALFSYSVPKKNSDKLASFEDAIAQTETVNSYYTDVIAGYETDLTDQASWVDKAGVQYTGGGTSSSTTSKRTGYIDISGYDFLEFTLPVYTGSTSYGVAFYDENQTYITGIKAGVDAEEAGANVTHIRMRDDVKYMRTTYLRDSYEIDPFYLKGYKIAEADKQDYVRPFHAEEISDTVAKIKAAQDEPNLSFWWFTDVHYYSQNFMTQGCVFVDMVNSIKAMDKEVQMDFVLDTGDLHDGDKNRVEHTARIEEMMQKLSETGLPVIRSIGNHDMHYSYSSNADPYDYKDQFKYYLARTKQASSYLFDTYGTSFFIDFDELKIRMIVVNTNNATGGEYHFDIASVNTWVQNVALDTPDGYEVLFVAHLAPLNRHNKNNSPYGGSAFSTIMTDYETETKKLVGIIYGHTHLDATFAEPYLAVASASEKFSDMEEDFVEDGWLYPAKARHDVSEQCFNAVVLKPLSKVMDVIRFGAGYDRKLHYDLNTVAIEGTLELVPTINAITWESLDTTICTVSEGTVTGVATGMTGIRAYDADGNFEMWRVSVVN